MKTLADLKRDLTIGKKVKLLRRYGNPNHNVMNKDVRHVVKTNTQGICLNADKEAKNGSFLDYPKATLLDYDGKNITVYTAGHRVLTQEEKDILSNQPRDKEQERIDMLSDGSTMFYRRKRYYKESGKNYLFGVSTEKGKRLVHGTRAAADDGSYDNWLIEDDKIKGKEVLFYEVV